MRSGQRNVYSSIVRVLLTKLQNASPKDSPISDGCVEACADVLALTRAEPVELRTAPHYQAEVSEVETVALRRLLQRQSQ